MCPLTSDRQFFSPRFRPCCLNKGVLTDASIAGYQGLDLQCWECIFQTHSEAQLGSVWSFLSKSWVLWTLWHSQCMRSSVKNSVKIRWLQSFFVFDVGKDGHCKSCEILILKKKLFEPWPTCKFQKFPFWHIWLWFFLPFKQLEVFQLHQNFAN